MTVPIPVLGLLVGMGVGLGLALILAGLTPTRTRLSDALEALSVGVTSAGTLPAAPQPQTLQEKLGEQVGSAASSLGLAAPTRELALLEISSSQYWAEKALYALIGLCSPLLYLLLSTLLGLPMSPLPVFIGLVMAVVFWMLPDANIRKKAKQMRWEMSVAVVSYLRLVAIRRLGSAAVTTAMESSAQVSSSWMFNRIGQALMLARLSGEPPWVGLHQLADRLLLPDLHEVADVTSQSAQGGAIAGNLTARAASLRDRQLNAAIARAGDVTTYMIGPLSLLALTFMLALFLPAAASFIGF